MTPIGEPVPPSPPPPNPSSSARGAFAGVLTRAGSRSGRGLAAFASAAVENRRSRVHGKSATRGREVRDGHHNGRPGPPDDTAADSAAGVWR